MNIRRIVFNTTLGLVLVALLAMLWLTRAPTAAAPHAVADVAPAAIERIEIHHADDVIVITRGANGRWRLRRPVVTRADPQHVRAVLQLAAAKPRRRYARDALEASTTGLATPELTVRFNDGPPIAVGGPGPATGRRYLRTAHALLLAPVPMLGHQRLAWPQWIAPTLMAHDAHLVKLTLAHATLKRSARGGWTVVPASADHGADAAQATIDAWRHSKALSIEAADTSQQRSARVTLHFAGAPERRLDVIARTPDLVLRDPALGVDYHFAANRAAPMLDMRHPDALGAITGAPPDTSRILLRRAGASPKPD